MFDEKKFNSISYQNDFRITSIDSVRFQKVLKQIGKRKQVLDLGCGDGFFMEKIKAEGNIVEGVEISVPAVRKARGKGFMVYNISLNDDWSSKLNKLYDIIFAGELIEHIFDTDRFLQNCRNALKKNGSLVITTPNVASLGRRLLLLFGKNPLIETTARKTDAGHIRYFTHQTLINLLLQNRFKVTYMASGVINFDNRGKYYSSLLARIFPTLGNTIIITAKKE